MANEISGKYEVVIPVTSADGTKAAGEMVELSHEDAEVFLARGFVREADAPAGHENDGGSGDDPGDEFSVTPDAGREALLEAGFATDDEVRAASDEELLAVNGVGPKLLEKIREILPSDRSESQ